MSYKKECKHCLKHTGKCDEYEIDYPCNLLPTIKISYLQLNSKKVFIEKDVLIEATIIGVMYDRECTHIDFLEANESDQLYNIDVRLVDANGNIYVKNAYALYKTKHELKLHLECEYEVKKIQLIDKYNDRLEYKLKEFGEKSNEYIKTVLGVEE